MKNHQILQIIPQNAVYCHHYYRYAALGIGHALASIWLSRQISDKTSKSGLCDLSWPNPGFLRYWAFEWFKYYPMGIQRLRWSQTCAWYNSKMKIQTMTFNQENGVLVMMTARQPAVLWAFEMATFSPPKSLPYVFYFAHSHWFIHDAFSFIQWQHSICDFGTAFNQGVRQCARIVFPGN